MLKSGHTTPRLKLFSILSLILEKSRNSVSQITKFFKAWYLLISLVSSLPTFPRLFTIYLYGHILSCLWSLACGCSLSKIPPPPPTFPYLAPSSCLTLQTCPDSPSPSSVSLQHPVYILLEYSFVSLYYYLYVTP